MKAVLQRAFGDLDVLDLADLPDPEPGPGEVVVAVRATARTLAGSAPVRRETSVAFAASESSSALFRSP